MKASELRIVFLDFFKRKGHAPVKSDSLIPACDPTLLFTGAGMNQFKDYFLGIKTDVKRATSVQKCLRTGDLDVVGKTPYHHSFFEMLGNFSFGDYFKRDAIRWAWEFLTKELAIDPARLLVSVYKSDVEALDIWIKEIGIPEKLIARLGDHTNFWPADVVEEGPNGPCGPCSEIFYDQGPSWGNSTVKFWADDESGRYAEIWNLVFTQYERKEDGALVPLRSKNIDTGMGLERLACVMQRKRSNFETDLFQPILNGLRKKISGEAKGDNASLNAIADHARAAVMAISDGAHPSNEGRGYVVRKLIRRAVWKGKAAHLSFPLLPILVPDVVAALEAAYPELRQTEKSVTQIISNEETRFNETIESGLKVAQKFIREAKNRKSKKLSGEEAFQLYDTYGFPDELTRAIAAENGVAIDEQAFQKSLEDQRRRAKESSKLADTIFAASDVNAELLTLPKSEFLGYEAVQSKGKVIWFNVQKDQGQGVVALDQTPFYPEGGGQVGDSGMIEGEKFLFSVEDTQRKEGVILHYGKLLGGQLEIDDACEATVDSKRRTATKRNHTATHLLQSALRAVLGPHVRQVGSLVNPDKLRFDFTHGKPLTGEEIKIVEDWVNEAVVENEEVQTKAESYEDAIKTGALAFFGDKYSARVRTVHIEGRSKELCGGIHCNRTGDIGGFLITSESSIGSGTRRIEAITGLNAIQYARGLKKTLSDIAACLKTIPEQLPAKVEHLAAKVRDLERGITEGQGRNAAFFPIDEVLRSAKNAGLVQIASYVTKGAGLEILRGYVDLIRLKAKKMVVGLFSITDGKVNLVIALTRDLESSALNALELARSVSPFIKGSAGGRKDFAQGGGRDPQGIPAAIEALYHSVEEQVR